MVLHGRVRNGVIVLEGASLPEGTPVRVQAEDAPRRRRQPAKKAKRSLLKHAGTAKNLPADAARNLDHYLYGHPKQ